MKKFLSLVLVLTLVLALAAPVFAYDTAKTPSDQKTDLTVKVDGAKAGTAYTLYRILDVATYDQSAGAYRYVLASDVKDGLTVEQFLELSAAVDGETKKVGDFLKVDDTLRGDDTTKYIVWTNGVGNADDAQKLSQILMANKAKFTEAGATQTAAADNAEITWTVTAGYYLLDSSMGVLCGMDTAQKEGDNLVVTISEKNEGPSIEKKVKEGETFIDGKPITEDVEEGHSHANVGDKVEFETTINVKKGAEKYVLHDKMTEGLTFNNDIVVKDGETALALGTDYTVANNTADGCTFEITFTETYLDTNFGQTHSVGKALVVTYSATLNNNAVINGEGNKNTTHLSYGEKLDGTQNDTPDDTTITYSFDFTLDKQGYNVSNETHDMNLADAHFTLYKDAACTTAVQFTKVDDKHYKVNTQAADTNVTDIVTVADGDILIDGLDHGTYYLKETQAPAGYNLMDEVITVNIDDKGVTTVDVDGNKDTVLTNDTLKVENRTGSELPSTGGIGTTIFYIVGAVLMAGAAILLITKKRMSAE